MSTRRNKQARQSQVRRVATRSPKTRLGFESLESRRLQAQFGIPWSDSTHLTMSFAPDGTTAYGEPSALFASLDAQMPRAVWQGAIQRAVSTWSSVANVNVGVVVDGGQSFGVDGPVQGDRRFGDIRVGGYPMDPRSLAVSIPPSTALNGTFSGDIFINTRESFTPEKLYAVALHEVGHALGIPHSTNSRSVMFPQLNFNTTLTGSDIAAIRSLYGIRSIDLNEGSKSNDSIRNATRIKYSQDSSGYTGSTPLVAYGDLGRPTDRDFFELKGLTGYTGSISIRVQTQGISMMAPEVTIRDEQGTILLQRSVAGNEAGIVNLRIPQNVADKLYYIQVNAKPGATHGLGRYAIGVTFDGRLLPTAIPLDQVMRGNFEEVPPEKVDLLFQNPNAVLLEDDLGLNDTTLGAIALKAGPGQPNDRDLSVQGSLNSPTDVDYYRVDSPRGSTPWVWTLSLLGGRIKPVLPRVEVFNANLVQIPVQILVNSNGRYAIQATGIEPNKAYFVRVFLPSNTTGNYVLNSNFGTVAADLTTMATGLIPLANSSKNYDLYIAKTQLFNFVMDATGATGTLTMRIRNELGQVVYTQQVQANQTGSAFSAMLAPGKYTVRFSANGPLAYRLRGLQITDPIGPVVDSATLTPQYQSPTNPAVFNYPDGSSSVIPFKWLLTV